MNYYLTIRTRAQLDILEAGEWYDQRESGVAAKFALAVKATIDSLLENPKIHRIRSRTFKYRSVPVDRFPYRVIYRIDGAEIDILAVMHTARRDREWKKRI